MKIDKLKKDYEKAVAAYVKDFEEKQGLEMQFWVADLVGHIACFGDLFFNFEDIVWDVNSEQPKGLILQWADEVLDDPVDSTSYYGYTRRRAKAIESFGEVSI